MSSIEAREQRSVAKLLEHGLDEVWKRQRARLDTLSQDEYLWEPVEGCWTVHPIDGVWHVDAVPDIDPEPAPVTTIAWRLWHIASDCLASYTAPALGPWPLEVTGTAWYEAVDDAIAAVDVAWEAFRRGIAGLGDEGMWQELGDHWGPYAPEPWSALVVHALDEVTHHGAEIGLMRDLFAHQPRGPR